MTETTPTETVQTETVELEGAAYREHRATEIRAQKSAPEPQGSTPEDFEKELAQEEKGQESKPAEESLWKRAGKKEQPESIPYGRFVEVNTRAKQLEQQTAELQARLDAIDAEKAKQPKAPTTPDEIDISKYVTANGEPDVERYLRDLTKTTAEQARREAVEEIRRERAQELQQAQQRQQIESYSKRLEDYYKADPDIIAKEEFVVGQLTHPNNRQFVHPETIKALAEDPNSAHVIAQLAESEADLLNLMRDPITAIRTIARLSAKAEIAPPKAAAPEAPQIQAVERKFKVPTTLDSGAPKRDISSLEGESYRKARLRQELAARKR